MTDPIRVLLVDDSATDRIRGLGLLNKQRPEWDVVGFSSGAEALADVAQVRPDVIITDLVMPEMDGRELLRTVNRDYPTVPVVLITAQGDDQIAAECVGLGAVNYVPKRLLAEKLISVLDEVVQAEAELRTTRRVLQYIVENRCQFQIDSDVDHIRNLVNFVRERLQATLRFSADKVQQITFAVRESLLNAHFHGNLQVNSTPLELSRHAYIAAAAERRGNQELADRSITLSMALTPEQVEFEIADEGPGFDLAQITDLVGPPDNSLSKGNGIRLIRSSVASVTWNDAGNIVTLTDPVTG